MGNQPAGIGVVGRSDGWAVGSAAEIGFHILDRYPASDSGTGDLRRVEALLLDQAAGGGAGGRRAGRWGGAAARAAGVAPLACVGAPARIRPSTSPLPIGSPG